MLLYAWYILLEKQGIKVQIGRLKYHSFLFLSFSFMYVLSKKPNGVFLFFYSVLYIALLFPLF